MEGKEITELDQQYLLYSIQLLQKKYNTVDDLIRFWTLFGPCLEWCPKPEIRKPWMVGLNLID